MTDLLSQTKPLGTINPVSDEAPIPTEAEQESIIRAAWRNGHAKGWAKGMRQGFSNGKSTLGRPWFFFTAMGFMCGGVIAGMFMQFLVTCGPDIPCGVQIPGDWGFAPVNVEQPNE